MALPRSITVTVRMRDGEFRAGLELRAVTEEDGHDLAEMIDTAEHYGLYDDDTKILEFAGLAGQDLYWRGLGVENRDDFEAIPHGNWANGVWRVLFLSDPRPRVQVPDDETETCLCQNGHSCRTCRLQKKLKSVRAELVYIQGIETQYYEGMGGLIEKIEQYQERYGKLPLQNGEEEQINQNDVEGERENLEEYAEEDTEHESEDEDEDPNALEYTVQRAHTAELENGHLIVEIERLKRENKVLHNKLSKLHNDSSSSITEMTSSKRANPSEGDASDDFFSDSGYPQHGRGGKTRPGRAANPRAEHRRRMGGGTGGKMSRGGHAKTMQDPEKAAKKRPHDIYDEDGDDDDDSDEEPPFKRHRSAAAAPGRAVEGHKAGQRTGANTCGPEKLAKKKYQERSDDSDDDTFIPGPQSRRSRISRNAGGASLAPKASQTITKTGRRTNSSQAGFLDILGLSSLPSSSRNTLGVFGSGSATSNTMSGFMDDESDAATSETPQAIFSTAATPAATLSTTTLANPPQTATTLTASTLANPTQTGTTLTTSTAANLTQTATILAATSPANTAQPAAASRRTQGWSNAELQALISLVRAHRNASIGPNGQRPVILHDVRLFELMSRQLAAQGINRSAGACKNEWNRRGRQLSGIDNRKIANPSQMATSLQ